MNNEYIKIVNGVVELLSLTDNDKVIDIGAGKGEILLRIIEKFGSNCTSIEKYEDFSEQLRVYAKNRGTLGNIEIITQDAKLAIKSLNEQLNVGICIGSSHALGDYCKTIKALKPCCN